MWKGGVFFLLRVLAIKAIISFQLPALLVLNGHLGEASQRKTEQREKAGALI